MHILLNRWPVLQCGADPEAIDFLGQTALMVAIFSGAELLPVHSRLALTGAHAAGLARRAWVCMSGSNWLKLWAIMSRDRAGLCVL